MKNNVELLCSITERGSCRAEKSKVNYSRTEYTITLYHSKLIRGEWVAYIPWK